MNLVLVIKDHRLLRCNIGGRQRQESLTLHLANGDIDCIASMLICQGCSAYLRLAVTLQCSCIVPSGWFCLPFAMNLCRFSVTSLLTTSGHPFLFIGLLKTGRITSWDKADSVSNGDSAKSPYVTCKEYPQ